MAEIKITTSTNSKSYSIINDYYRYGIRTTKVIDRIGNYDTVLDLANKEGIVVGTLLNNYLNNF